jgi:Rrf2 family transcriptional regulator, iron-sulfur cluster assembly transcription factor
MRMSKKAEYALRAMVAMSRRGQTRPVLIHELSESERVPVKFLEQILLELKKSGLLRSKRGVGGGYLLNRPPDQILVGEVLELIDGPFVPMACALPGPPGRCGCGRRKPCGLASTFGELQEQVRRFLSSRSLADVVKREESDQMNFEI